MAQKRMFSLQIVDTDAFLDMPQSSQLLYFHLSMRADDEGFIGNPKKIIRLINSNEDDFKILLAKRFVLSFESGVVVIKHWLIHNTIRMDRFNRTVYQDEKKSLYIKENNAYTDDGNHLATNGIPSGNHLATQVKSSQVKLSEIANGEKSPSAPINPLFELFEPVNPSYRELYKNKTQRGALERMVKTHGEDPVKHWIGIICKTNGMPYAPVITTPFEMEKKLGDLKAFITREKSKQ